MSTSPTGERRIRLILAAGCIVAAGVALISALAEGTPELNEDDARDFTQEALGDAGFRAVKVLAEPRESDYRPPDRPDAEPVPVWVIRAQVRYRNRPRNVVVAVHRTEGRAVRLSEGKTGRFFTAAQFAKLRDYAYDEAVDRQRERDIAGIVAFILLVLVAAWVAVARV